MCVSISHRQFANVAQMSNGHFRRNQRETLRYYRSSSDHGMFSSKGGGGGGINYEWNDADMINTDDRFDRDDTRFGSTILDLISSSTNNKSRPTK